MTKKKIGCLLIVLLILHPIVMFGVAVYLAWQKFAEEEDGHYLTGCVMRALDFKNAPEGYIDPVPLLSKEEHIPPAVLRRNVVRIRKRGSECTVSVFRKKDGLQIWWDTFGFKED